MPITISLTDAMTSPLPSFLSLSNNILSGTSEHVDRDTIYPIKLRATNTDSDGADHFSDVEFTITVENDTGPEGCEPPKISFIPKVNIVISTTSTSDFTGIIDISDYITGSGPPQVVDDPEYASLRFIPNSAHNTGQIAYRIPYQRSRYIHYIGTYDQRIVAKNGCGTTKRRFTIQIRVGQTNPPVFGECPNVTLDAGQTHSDSVSQYLTSTHTFTPTFAKVQLEPAADPSGRQNADWWDVDEVGNLSITAPTVRRDETNQLSIMATNEDGFDVCHFDLTVIYIPQPPEWDTIPIQEVAEGAVTTIKLNTFINNTFTNVRIDSITKVDSRNNEIFLKSVIPTEATSQAPVGTLLWSTNASDSGAVGTSPLLPVGQAPTIPASAPNNISTDLDYTVTVTAINTGLVTTPRYPSNSDQTSFTLRITNVDIPPEGPSWVAIPLQTSVSGESISLAIGQYARNNPTSYSILSTCHASGVNAGSIILQIGNTGIVTRQGGAVAPNVTAESRYSVTVRATNSGGNADATFTWRIVPTTPPSVGAPAFVASEFAENGYPFYEYNPATGFAINNYIGTAPVVKLLTTNRGRIYIEGVGSTIYALFSNASFGTITYDPGHPNFRMKARISIIGDVSGSGFTVFHGLTSIGSILYSFGRIGGGTTKLCSIDPNTRVATPINTASSADNLGLTGTIAPGSLTSVGSTIYGTLIQNNITIFVSIPTSGTNRGIATVLNSNVQTGLGFTISALGSRLRGMETFGTTIQGLIQSNRLHPSIFPLNFTSSGTYSLVGSVDQTRDRYFSSITQYAITKPIISRIPVQLVQEGQPISFPLSGYVTGATSYRIGALTAVTTGAPIFPVQVSSSAVITGTSGNTNAPLVNADSYYSAVFSANNSAGETRQIITIGVLNAAPIWQSIPAQFVNEGQVIDFSVLPYVRNQPTHFSLGTITKTNDLAPNLNLQISNSGRIYGVGNTINAPLVDQDESYTIQVTAENTAGSSTTTLRLTIEDLGDTANQVPYVFSWDLPEEPQSDAFDILVDFNIPIYGLCPGSFTFEGVELQGTPFLLWAPIPSNDVSSNRPTASDRNLDYLTTPVPVTGTKYFKLSFPRNILPDNITKEQVLNIYLTAHAARGGQG